MDNLGQSKGEICNRDGCDGIINERGKEGGCSCHTSQPCDYCTENDSYCPKCEWDGREEQIEYEEAQRKASEGAYDFHKSMMDKRNEWKKELQAKMRGELPVDKIEYDILSHTHFSQICEGVYPKETTMGQVLEKVRGTFGGRFEKFGNGVFKYIAYTD